METAIETKSTGKLLFGRYQKEDITQSISKLKTKKKGNRAQYASHNTCNYDAIKWNKNSLQKNIKLCKQDMA